MTATASEASSDKHVSTATTAPVPKRITNAQTVCNEKNEKGKPCWGHLKQLKTAGEPAEVHLRGDDVLFKCQTCGTYYMGPPLGHVRDPQKQHRFVEAELSALLQAAGGTLPVIKKDARGVFVMETTAAHAPAAKPATSPAAPALAPSAAKAPAPAAAKPATPAAAKPAAKADAEPNRQLMHRSTYSGVVDGGPVAGETFEQKVARLKAVSAGAKRRTEEGGGPVAPTASATEAASQLAPEEATTDTAPADAVVAPAAPPVSATPAATAAHKPTGQADRSLMLRLTYGGVKDTGPVAGETFEQKVQRLAALAAAAKKRAEGE
ncbi:MAG TPA: hypothetical protein VN951_04055 [Pyrinomonadaceae bacterium]|nr:hypothetical protein [Pyrinomonadaceae bacterium]